MLATKNRAAREIVFFLTFAVLLAGCVPPGPRALLDGQRLLAEGRYDLAVAKLEFATSLMDTNAQAWNYRGLAHHRAGQTTNAVFAYTKAIKLDQNLAEARFNLGCLWLEQNKLDAAKRQFTTYTSLRNHAVEGFLKLGTAQYRGREFPEAADSFQKALNLSPKNPEALNGRGLVQLQRNRPREAAQDFAAALKHRPDYRPARLNLATTSYRFLNDATGALQNYRAYLELKPRAADWDAVNSVVKSLELQLAVQRRPSPANLATQAVVHTNTLKSQTTPSKIEPTPSVAKTSPAPPTAVAAVKLPPEPVIKTSPDPAPQTSPPPRITVTTASPSTSAPPVVASVPKPAKRGFLQNLNPVNLFRRQPAAPAKAAVTPLPVTAEFATSTPPPSPALPPVFAVQSYERYTYFSPPVGAAGNRSEAERARARGEQSYRAKHLAEASAAYQQAVQLDPAYFEAHYDLGLVTYALRNYRQSLIAWENALAIRPESADARYGFALALKAANYPRDAATEFEKILATNPMEARAHLGVGNLYAQALHDPSQARAHYLKVLELDPRHPQATEIRYWLVGHPP